jgi:hypothetical protein
MLTKVLPFEKIAYHSHLNKEELTKHLFSQFEQEKAFGFGAAKTVYSKKYIGNVYENQFEVKRAINYRNSFLPIIKGIIKEDLRGSKIDVTMNLNPVVKVFMIIWFSGVLVACIFTVVHLTGDKNLQVNPEPFKFIPFLMLLIGAAMVYFGFKVESKKSIKDLEETLQAKVIEQ